MTTWNQTSVYTIYVSKIGIKTIYWGILFPITDIKSRELWSENSIIPLIWGLLIPVNINNDDNAYEQYIIFWLFIQLPVFTRANKVTELSFDFDLQIIYFLKYQMCVFLSSKQEFFNLICKYPEVRNPNCFFMLFS